MVTADGLMLDPSKIEAVIKMEKPGDLVPKLTDAFRPISVLAQQDTVWMRGEAQEKPFTKRALTYLDPSKPLTIQCDGSNY